MSKFILLPLGALLLAREATAWWDSGHYFSACVARETLITKGRQDVVDAASKLLALYDDNGVTNDFCRAATWLDWIKLGSTKNESEHLVQLTGLNNLHFIDFITTNEHTNPTNAYIDDYLNNATFVTLHQLLDNAVSSLMPPVGQAKQPDTLGTVYGQNMLMRWLLHLMGDAHQPMHMIAAYHQDLGFECDGQPLPIDHNDGGGNGILIQLDTDVDADLKTAAPANLHYLWDSMGGYDRGYANTISDEEMVSKAKELITHYGADKAKADGFVLEGFALPDVYKKSAALAATKDAVWGGRFAYRDISIPDYLCPPFDFVNWPTAIKNKCCKKFLVTKEHGQWVKETSMRLVAIAGYRIAWVLEKWFDGMSTRLMNDIDFEYNRQVLQPEPSCPTEATDNTEGASSLIVGSAAAVVASLGGLLYH